MKKKPVQQQKKSVKSNQVVKKDYKNLLWIIGIAIFTTIVYSQVFDNRLTNFDDVVYITENPYIQDLNLSNISKIFSEFYYGGYYPMTLLSFGIDKYFFPQSPSVFIIMNFILHLINTILLFLLIHHLFKKRLISVITAILFAIHPMHVESVAWVSERKDVLYTFFYFLGILVYLKYIQTLKLKFILITFILFVLSCMSKTMAVAMVAVLPLLDWLNRRKIFEKRAIIEKLPFLFCGLFFGILAIISQKSIGAIDESGTLPIIDRVLYAGYGFTTYLVKLLYPFNQSVFYPYPVPEGHSIPVYYWLFVGSILVYFALLVYLFKKQKEFAFALSIFLLNIVLVLQMIQINDFVMADRFTYVAAAGIFLAMAFAYDFIVNKFSKHSKTILYLGVFYILVLGYKTYNYANVWQDSVSLWDNVISKYPTVYKAYDKRGLAKADELQDYKSAIIDYDSALSINPVYYASYINRGYARFVLGDSRGSLDDYNKAIELKPDYYSAYNNRGSTLANMGKLDAAMADFSKAILLNKENGKAYCNRGLVYINQNKPEEAISDFTKCIEISPTYYPAFNFRAMVYSREKKYELALKDLDLCLKIQPYFAEALYNRGVLHLQLNQKRSACEDLHKAASLGFQRAYNIINTYCN